MGDGVAAGAQRRRNSAEGRRQSDCPTGVGDSPMRLLSVPMRPLDGSMRPLYGQSKGTSTVLDRPETDPRRPRGPTGTSTVLVDLSAVPYGPETVRCAL
jgi:hypothetical protein